MNIIAGVIVLQLVFLSNAKPANKSKSTKLIFPEDIINSSATFQVYSGQHDIYNIFVGLSENDHCIFFGQADIDERGQIQDHGLYMTREENTAVKLRESGRDGALATDGSKTMYVGAKDGIYRCNCNECKPEKYGVFNDSIIGIVMENRTGIIYVLSEDKKMYKITDQGNKVYLDDRVKNAEQIMMDGYNNLYYYGADKQIYILNDRGTTQLKGMPPSNASFLKLLRPPKEDMFVPIIVDDKLYAIFPNGTFEQVEIQIPKVSAFNMEHSGMFYMGVNKKLYLFSPTLLVLQSIFESIGNFKRGPQIL